MRFQSISKDVHESSGTCRGRRTDLLAETSSRGQYTRKRNPAVPSSFQVKLSSSGPAESCLLAKGPIRAAFCRAFRGSRHLNQRWRRGAEEREDIKVCVYALVVLLTCFGLSYCEAELVLLLQTEELKEALLEGKAKPEKLQGEGDFLVSNLDVYPCQAACSAVPRK